MSEVQSADNTSLMSYWIQMDCLRISEGTYALLEFIHTYTAFGLLSVICQNGYLMMPGVLYPTPTSRNTICSSLLHSMKDVYAWAALYHPASWKKVWAAHP